MPNSGKSTLYNALMGEDLAIVNPKAQTTRHRILGIKNGGNFQIIYSDTPGVLKAMSYKMHEKMMHSVKESVDDSDVLILLLDIKDKEYNEELLRRFNQYAGKKIVVLNKMDLSNQEELEAKMQNLRETIPADHYVPISALKKFNHDLLERIVLDFLPVHPAYFDGDDITDRSERFFVNEMVRNNILRLYSEEIPYSSEVVTQSFKEDVKIIRIQCEIVVERDSQKKIVIGSGGAAIKKLGIASRKDLEAFFQKQVYLELFVKVRENWRDNPNMLKQFGYDLE
jgi:GTP-binding protein Era